MMESYRDKLLYVGSDDEFVDLLETALVCRDCDIERTRDASQVVERLQAALPDEGATEDSAILGEQFQDQYAGVLLDTDHFTQTGADILKEIKTSCGGVPVIVLTTETTLLSVCLAYLDMAEGLCFKPVDDYQQLLETIEDMLRKHRRWTAQIKGISPINSSSINVSPV